jgi:flagellar FliL protein
MADDDTTDKSAKSTKSTKSAKAAKRSKKGTLTLVAVLLLGAAAGYVLKGGGSSEDPAGAVAATVPPEPGTMIDIDALSLNLAGDRYLRVGVAVQLVKGEGADPTAWLAEQGPVVRDLLIATLGGAHVADLSDAAGRDVVRADLLAKANAKLDDKVYALYFTEFVMQ